MLASRSLHVLIDRRGDRLRGSPRVFFPRPALAIGFVLIHPAVGRGEQHLVGVPVVGEDRRADAEADTQALARTRFEEDGVDRPLQLVPLQFGLVGAAA